MNIMKKAIFSNYYWNSWGAFILHVSLWCAAGFLLGFFYRELKASFLPIAGPVCFIWVFAGLLILAESVWTAVASGRPNRAVIAFFTFLLLGIGFCINWRDLAEYGDTIRFQWRFRGLESHYSAIIGRLRNREKPVQGWQKEESIDYYVENGSPLRVVFRQPGGILDNWQGVVYDPSGSVLRAREFKPDWSNWDDPSLAQIRSLFGGDLCKCVHVKGHFYRCWFT
jgi:hypothetical protein